MNLTRGTGPVVDVRGLRREFVVRTAAGRLRRERRVVRAVDDVTFALRRGETVGYIGANGAGKSTTIKMLTGILTPTAGEVRTCGLHPVRQRRILARHIGVVFGQRSQLWWDLPLRDSLRILAALHRLPSAQAREREAELVDRLELGAFLDQPVRQLSLGQRMRGEVAAALLHSPDLIVLDEPTVGLDVLSKERLRVFLREELAAHGRTLLLTTHDMDDVERLCERLLVVDRGRLVYDGDIAGLVARVGARRVLVVDLAEPSGPLEAVVAAVPGSTLLGVEAGGLRQRIAFSPAAVTAADLLAAVTRVAPVRDLSIEEPDIEDVVRRLYESTGR
ncbi:MAG: ATP-binding cassette domain-containing protein [Kineosporiaceae bacterium]